MGRNDPMDQYSAKIDDIFDRVHRKARPRPNIDVAMMQGMHMLVQKRHVQKAVYPIEIKTLLGRDQQKYQDKPYRMYRPRQHWSIAIGQGPKYQHLISRPNYNTTDQSPKHIVSDLPPQGKLATILHQRPEVIFQMLALFGKSIKIQM